MMSLKDMRIELGDEFKPQTIKKSLMLKKGKFYCFEEVEKELRYSHRRNVYNSSF